MCSAVPSDDRAQIRSRPSFAQKSELHPCPSDLFCAMRRSSTAALVHQRDPSNREHLTPRNITLYATAHSPWVRPSCGHTLATLIEKNASRSPLAATVTIICASPQSLLSTL